jgi:V/A-type H+-transporting ATPase subunit K
LQWLTAGSVFALVMLAPVVALAAEGEAAGAVAWQATTAKALGAAFAMAVSAWSAGYAQSRIGAAGAGTLAERPEAGTNIIVLQALPEIVALLGFAIAFLILR